MARKTKTEWIDRLTKMVDNHPFKCIHLDNVFIEDGGRYKLIDLCYDDNELGVTLADWFYPLTELTNKELMAVYADVRNLV